MQMKIPQLSLVILVGASGAGKSSFARRHFLPTETLSSDFCRALVSDDENSMNATSAAFATLHFIAARRLERGLLTVIDATNVQPEARRPLLELAREFHVLPVAIVLDTPEAICLQRNELRPDRNFGPHVVRNHIRQLRRSLRELKREGFRHVYVLDSEKIEAAQIVREKLWNDRRDDFGPFDIIGDVHGCADELRELLEALGYEHNEATAWQHPQGRRALFVGDLVDRGPKVVAVLQWAMAMCRGGNALCVPGNHDIKLMQKLRGRDVKVAHGLGETLQQLESETPEFRDEVADFIDGLVSHYVFAGGDLVVAHAGLKASMQGRGSGAVRAFCLYGETTGETDEFGLPVRYAWASDYRGRAHVVYGHTPVPEAQWLNKTIDIDTGCVFGGQLSALRYPEMELVSVAAQRTYAQPARPFLAPQTPLDGLTAQQENDDLLDLGDVSGKLIINTRLARNVTIREENSGAALEIMSRFAADPRWLIYLPPTMSPCETSREIGVLEHPAQAFDYYRAQGVTRVVCEEKHMGSRAVVVLCRDGQAALRRFGVENESGIIYTRTGRRFFDDLNLESAILDRLRAALDAAKFWEEFETDWACFDCELMPWSAKARELLKNQYAPVGAAAIGALESAVKVLSMPNALPEIAQWRAHQAERLEMARDYVAAYGRYCWEVASIADWKLAPFHILATENRVHCDRSHVWHMETLAKIAAFDREVLLATPFLVVQSDDEKSRSSGIAWWQELTARGGEGMVVKPFDFIAIKETVAAPETKSEADEAVQNPPQSTLKPSAMVQPAVKCRGREYLRIIYGPEYSAPENLERLRSRGLGAKRSLAAREFALGIEALERFVRGEPLRRVHQCVFGVLALESEPLDPRL